MKPTQPGTPGFEQPYYHRFLIVFIFTDYYWGEACDIVCILEGNFVETVSFFF